LSTSHAERRAAALTPVSSMASQFQAARRLTMRQDRDTRRNSTTCLPQRLALQSVRIRGQNGVVR
jgi:hypothetical protein